MPLVVNGRQCLRRVAKLYQDGRDFGCRRCHGLTYRSSQEAHQDERRALMIDRWMVQRGSLERSTPGELCPRFGAIRRLV